MGRTAKHRVVPALSRELTAMQGDGQAVISLTATALGALHLHRLIAALTPRSKASDAVKMSSEKSEVAGRRCAVGPRV